MSAGWAVALIIAWCFIALVGWALCVVASTDTPPRIPEVSPRPERLPGRGPCAVYEDVRCGRWRACDRDPGWQAPDDCPFDAYETTTSAPSRTTYTVTDHDATLIRAKRALVLSDLHMRAKGHGHERSTAT